MARAGTRSQRQPSQSQSQARQASRPSQSQRARRARADEEEEEEEEDVDVDGEAQDGDDAGQGPNELEIKANALVRLALFTEHRRVPLKRDEISKKVLGSKSRAFTAVFALAQEILRRSFGMELVELQTRLDRDKDNDPNQKELESMGVKKKAVSSGTKTYILRSLLDPTIVKQAAAPDADILRLEREERAGDADADDDEETRAARSTGSIFAWNSSDQVGSIGVMHVVLALILVNGRTISESDLRVQLKRLHLPLTAPVPLSAQSTNQSLTVEAYLNQLVRQGYLDRQRVGGPGNAAGKKRGRAPAATQAGAGDDNANAWEWRWGSRAMAEVGEMDIAKFVTEFMVERPKGGEEGEGEEERAGRRKQTEAVMKGVDRAAGGKLLDVL